MNVEEVGNPGYEEPRKSGGRSWMACFGIGCVVVLVLCAAGAIISYFAAGPQLTAMWEQMQIQQQNLTMAMDSDIVQEKLGSPVQPVVEIVAPDVTQEGDAQLITTRQKLKGPDGEGYLVSQVRIQPGTPTEQIKLYLQVGEEEINLMDMGDDFDLNIDDGAEMEEESEVMEEETAGAGT